MVSYSKSLAKLSLSNLKKYIKKHHKEDDAEKIFVELGGKLPKKKDV